MSNRFQTGLIALMLAAACTGARGTEERADGASSEVDSASSAPTDAGPDVAVALPDAPEGARRRLRLTYVFAGERQLHLAQIRDTELDMGCFVGRATDGQLRCLPLSYNDIEYLDAACSTAVSSRPPDATIGGYTSVRRDLACEGRWEPHRRLSTPMTAPTYRKSGATCDPQPLAPHAVYPLEPMTEHTVVITPVKGRVEAGVAMIDLEADGRRVTQTEFGAKFWDDTLGVACEVALYGSGDPTWVAVDGSLRCLPESWGLLVSTNEFSDETCQRPALSLAGGVPSGCLPPKFGGYSGGDPGCPFHKRFFKIGRPLTGAYVSQLSSGRCEPAAPRNYFESDGELSPESLPAAKLVIAEGSDRIRPLLVQTAAGSKPTLWNWDEALRALCSVGSASDGQMRCIPRGWSTTLWGYFADPMCTVGLATKLRADCSTPSFITVGSRLFRGGPIHQGPVFARKGPDCVSASSDAYVHYQVGQEEIPPSALAELHFEER